MKFTRLQIPEVVLLEPQIFGDERGWFYESFSQRSFVQGTGAASNFVQDNHSKSARGVLRGLHFQRAPHAQGKLVRVAVGSVFDVAVDIRRGSPTFGRWVGEMLSAENKRQLWIPEGFAHGFVALEDGTEFLYKTTALYDKASEGAIRWDDASIGILWPVSQPILNAKDLSAPPLSEAVLFGEAVL